MGTRTRERLQIWVLLTVGITMCLSILFIVVAVTFNVGKRQIGELILTGLIGFGLSLIAGVLLILIQPTIESKIEVDE